MRIKIEQEDALDHVTRDALLDTVFRFARDELAEAVVHLDDELLRARIARDYLASRGLGVRNGDAVFRFLTLSLMLGDHPFYELPTVRKAFHMLPPDMVPGRLLDMIESQGAELWPDP